MKKIIFTISLVLCIMLVGCVSKEISDTGKSKDGKFTFSVISGEVAETTEGVKVMNVTIKMDNNSDESATPIDSNCGVWGFQNGQDMPLQYDTGLQKK